MGHSPPHHFKFSWKYNKFTWQRTVCVTRHEAANLFGTSWTFSLQRFLHWRKKYLCVLLRQTFREKYSDLREKRFFFFFFLQEELTPRILWVWKNYDGREICELLKKSRRCKGCWKIPRFQASKAAHGHERILTHARVFGWEQKVNSLNLTSGQLNFRAVELKKSTKSSLVIWLILFNSFSFTNFQPISNESKLPFSKKTFYTRPFTSYIKDSWFLSRDSWWAGLSQLSRDRNLKYII